MKNSKIIVFSLIILSSCTVKFSNSLRVKMEKANGDLGKIQFYNSSPFVLQREVSSEETGIEAGKIKIKGGTKVEIIKIKEKTPAACEKSTDNTLNMLFELGSNKSIPFTYNQYSDTYNFITYDKEEFSKNIKNYSDISSIKFYGTISYDGKTYYYGYGQKPYLIVKKSQVNKILKEIRVAKGVIVR